jgi:hypothetical protein
MIANCSLVLASLDFWTKPRKHGPQIDRFLTVAEHSISHTYCYFSLT